MITGRVTAVLAGLFVVAGCTPGPGGADQDEPPLDPAVMALAPTAVDPRQISFPLDAYERNQSLGADVPHFSSLIWPPTCPVQLAA